MFWPENVFILLSVLKNSLSVELQVDNFFFLLEALVIAPEKLTLGPPRYWSFRGV